jgi:hypothetical protein
MQVFDVRAVAKEAGVKIVAGEQYNNVVVYLVG